MLVVQFGNYGSNNGQLNYPVGITIHNNRVYVADQCNERISVFQCDGNFIHTIGQSDQLNHPLDVAVSYGDHCISIFTLDGNYVHQQVWHSWYQ